VADLSEDIVIAKLAELDGRDDLAHALRCIAVEAAADGGNSG
jgi:hypothetical protein